MKDSNMKITFTNGDFLDIPINKIMGWLFLLAGVISLIGQNGAVYTFGWIILAKLCFIHADIEENK